MEGIILKILETFVKGISKKQCMGDKSVVRRGLRTYSWVHRWLVSIVCNVWFVEVLVCSLLILFVYFRAELHFEFLLQLIVYSTTSAIILAVHVILYGRWGTAFVTVIPEYYKAFKKVLYIVFIQIAWQGVVYLYGFNNIENIEDIIKRLLSVAVLSAVPLMFMLFCVAFSKNQCLFTFYFYDKEAEIFVKDNNYSIAQGGVRVILVDGTKIKFNLLKDNLYFLDNRILVVDSHKCKSPQLIMPEDYKELQVKLWSGEIARYVYAIPESEWVKL